MEGKNGKPGALSNKKVREQSLKMAITQVNARFRTVTVLNDFASIELGEGKVRLRVRVRGRITAGRVGHKY